MISNNNISDNFFLKSYKSFNKIAPSKKVYLDEKTGEFEISGANFMHSNIGKHCSNIISPKFIGWVAEVSSRNINQHSIDTTINDIKKIKTFAEDALKKIQKQIDQIKNNLTEKNSTESKEKLKEIYKSISIIKTTRTTSKIGQTNLLETYKKNHNFEKLNESIEDLEKIIDKILDEESNINLVKDEIKSSEKASAISSIILKIPENADELALKISEIEKHLSKISDSFLNNLMSRELYNYIIKSYNTIVKNFENKTEVVKIKKLFSSNIRNKNFTKFLRSNYIIYYDIRNGFAYYELKGHKNKIEEDKCENTPTQSKSNEISINTHQHPVPEKEKLRKNAQKSVDSEKNCIGKGSEGRVYEIREHENLVVKKSGSPIENEYNISKKLTENISPSSHLFCKVYDNFIYDNHDLIIMDRVFGKSMNYYYNSNEKISKAQAIKLINDARKACLELYAKGIIWVDINDGNIYNQDSGSLKIIDYGCWEEMEDKNKLSYYLLIGSMELVGWIIKCSEIRKNNEVNENQRNKEYSIIFPQTFLEEGPRDQIMSYSHRYNKEIHWQEKLMEQIEKGNHEQLITSYFNDVIESFSKSSF